MEADLRRISRGHFGRASDCTARYCTNSHFRAWRRAIFRWKANEYSTPHVLPLSDAAPRNAGGRTMDCSAVHSRRIAIRLTIPIAQPALRTATDGECPKIRKQHGMQPSKAEHK